MSEQDSINKVSTPNTVTSLRADLLNLGLEAGMVVLVHSSLSALGWTCGGEVAVIQALQEVVRPYGTLIMPTHSGHLSDPAGWENPPVPESWWETIRESMPPFDPEITPSRGMGAIPECFRSQPEVLRSTHPHVSFAAWGEKAAEVVSNHSLDYSLGEGSPLARIYEENGWVLLLGVGHDNNTSLHLAEYRADYRKKKEFTRYAPVTVDGHRRWKAFTDINIDSSDFDRIGHDFCNRWKSDISVGTAGAGKAQLFRQRLCVDFAAGWLHRMRT